MSEVSQGQRRLVSVADLLSQIPISTATMWREIGAGRFPKPLRIGARRIAFFQDEIDAWLAQRVAERETPKAPCILKKARPAKSAA